MPRISKAREKKPETLVRLLEALPANNSTDEAGDPGFILTGREIHFSESSPLFDSPRFRSAREQGAAVIDCATFHQLLEILRDSDSYAN